MAVCPEEAVTVEGLDPEMQRFSTLDEDAVQAAQTPSPAALVHLMERRRSCRVYKKKEVSRAVLLDLVKIGASAPSGTNCQKWTFRVLATRGEVEALGKQVARFYAQLNRVAAFAPARLFSKVFMKDVLGMYYREYYETVKRGLEEFAQAGRDRLFHGAPAAILIGSRAPASTPKEDCLLAAQNILLAAHSMGLGTCLIGMAVEAFGADPRIRRYSELQKKEKIHAVIAVGHPKIPYLRTTGRWRPIVKWGL
jgi:nitroreductase